MAERPLPLSLNQESNQRYAGYGGGIRHATPALPLFRHSIEGTGIQWTSRSNSLSPFLALICAGVSGKGKERGPTATSTAPLCRCHLRADEAENGPMDK